MIKFGTYLRVHRAFLILLPAMWKLAWIWNKDPACFQALSDHYPQHWKRAVRICPEFEEAKRQQNEELG